MSFPLPAANCPHCGASLLKHATVGEGNEIPRPGDISVCFYCGGVFEFDRRLRPLARTLGWASRVLGERDFTLLERTVRLVLQRRQHHESHTENTPAVTAPRP